VDIKLFSHLGRNISGWNSEWSNWIEHPELQGLQWEARESSRKGEGQERTLRREKPDLWGVQGVIYTGLTQPGKATRFKNQSIHLTRLSIFHTDIYFFGNKIHAQK
jgi:hypothetical protein